MATIPELLETLVQPDDNSQTKLVAVSKLSLRQVHEKEVEWVLLEYEQVPTPAVHIAWVPESLVILERSVQLTAAQFLEQLG